MEKREDMRGLHWEGHAWERRSDFEKLQREFKSRRKLLAVLSFNKLSTPSADSQHRT